MGGNASKVTAQDKAIYELKVQRDKLQQYQKRITVLTRHETEAAKELLARGDKQRALLALRRKKYQESLLAKTDAQLEQLQALASSVEFALIQKDVVFGLQQGTKVLQEIHKEMGGIENVERLMGENAEAIAYQKEISELLANKISNADEEEVEEELAQLEAEATVKKAATKTAAAALPDAPDTYILPSAPETIPGEVQEDVLQQQQAAKVGEGRPAVLAA